jgi:hypothetical protein
MTELPPHEILVIPQGRHERTSLLQQCHEVRISVFHHEQGFPLETEIDE